MVYFIKKNRFIFPILVIVFLFIIFLVTGFNKNTFFSFFSFPDDIYLLSVEKAANFLLHWGESAVTIRDHMVMLNDSPVRGFIPETLFKKWGIALMIIFWITKAPITRKLFFSFSLMIVSFILVTVYIATGSFLASRGIGIHSLRVIMLLLGILCMATILLIWYLKNKENILKSLAKRKVNTQWIEKKMPVIIITTYIYILLSVFILPYFKFQPWIKFIFISAQKILSLFGYEATVNGTYLIGYNGSIVMSKGCLGFRTMLVFASIVYVTGEDNKSRWIYIIAGLIFLNIVNIVRFVLLFIYIQKHGGYNLVMDLHDMYDYIIYIIVFILWVIWFEKFSDIRKLKKDQKEGTII